MLDGTFLKQTFPATAAYKDVWKYITDNNRSMHPITAIQVCYKITDMNCSMHPITAIQVRL